MCHFCQYFVGKKTNPAERKQLFLIAYMIEICMIKLVFS